MCSSLRSDLRSLAGFLLEMKAALSSPNMGSLAAFAFREGNQPCEKVVCVFCVCAEVRALRTKRILSAIDVDAEGVVTSRGKHPPSMSYTCTIC